MFSFFGGNKDIAQNSKKVKQWHNEHQAIVKYAVEILNAYEYNDIKKVKKILKKLNIDATNHLMDEDNTFMDIMEKAKEQESDQKIVQQIIEFRKSFRNTKMVLFQFFAKYSNPQATFDDNFKNEFTAIVDALGARIGFEEDNLYVLLNNK